MALPATTTALAAGLLFPSSIASSSATRKSRIAISTPSLHLSYNYTSSLVPSCCISHPSSGGGGRRRKSLRVQPCFAVQDTAAAEEVREEEAEGGGDKRRKVIVVNLPWNFSAPDIKNLFSQCGTVKDVEIIKQKNGKSRGFSFVMMGSGEEARAAIDKFDSYEVLGRIIRVDFAKSLKKPSPPPPAGGTVETWHKIYVSNLAWKVRSSNLREFFSAKFKPVSSRVVFDSPSGKSSGYGFVSFATKEEMEAAISEFDGKELMGRPVRLKISQRNGDDSGSEEATADNTEGQVEES